MRIDSRDYYVRQFQDMKGSVDTEGMSPKVFGQYVGACAVSLARARAQSVNASMLHGYVGNGAQRGGAGLVIRLCRENPRRFPPTQGSSESRPDPGGRRPAPMTRRLGFVSGTAVREIVLPK